MGVSHHNVSAHFTGVWCADWYVMLMIIMGVLVLHCDFWHLIRIHFPNANQSQILVWHRECFVRPHFSPGVGTHPAVKVIVCILAHRRARRVYGAAGSVCASGRNIYIMWHFTHKSIRDGMLLGEVWRIRIVVRLVPQKVYVGRCGSHAVLRVGDACPIDVSITFWLFLLVYTGDFNLDFISGI